VPWPGGRALARRLQISDFQIMRALIWFTSGALQWMVACLICGAGEACRPVHAQTPPVTATSWAPTCGPGLNAPSAGPMPTGPNWLGQKSGRPWHRDHYRQ
jgi:hypothetical protein